MIEGWHDEIDEYGFRRCFKNGELRVTVPPKGHVTRESTKKRARVDVPPLNECLVIISILVPAMIGGLIAGAGWLAVRMMRRR